MRRLFLVGVLALCLSPQAALSQQKPRMVTVTLRDGSVFQGELVESVPRDHTTLRLATGEIRRFEASDITEDATTTTAVASAILRLPLTFGAAEDAYSGADAVKVRVETNKPYLTYLYQAAPGGPAVGWQRLCLAPCNRPVDPRGLYRIGGEHIVDSEPFRLNGRTGTTTLYVDATSQATPAMGWISLGLGAALTIPGLYLLAQRDDRPPGDPGPSGSKLAGGIVLANGVPWLIVGVVLLAAGGTTVKGDSGERIGTVQPRSVALGGPFQLTSSGITF